MVKDHSGIERGNPFCLCFLFSCVKIMKIYTLKRKGEKIKIIILKKKKKKKRFLWGAVAKIAPTNTKLNNYVIKKFLLSNLNFFPPTRHTFKVKA